MIERSGVMKKRICIAVGMLFVCTGAAKSNPIEHSMYAFSFNNPSGLVPAGNAPSYIVVFNNPGFVARQKLTAPANSGVGSARRIHSCPK